MGREIIFIILSTRLPVPCALRALFLGWAAAPTVGSRVKAQDRQAGRQACQMQVI